MNSNPQSISLTLSILTFYFEVEDQRANPSIPAVRIGAGLTGEPLSRTSWVKFDQPGSQLFELKFAGMVYASGVLKYLIDGPSGIGIYGELAVGEPGCQSLFDDLLLALPVSETPLIPLQPSEPLIEPLVPAVTDRVSIENAVFSDLFHFVGLQRPAQIPPKHKRNFFSLQTGSSFYKSLLKAVQQKDDPRSVATQFLEKSCELEIIREVLSKDLFALIEQFEYLKKEFAKGNVPSPNSSAFKWAGISGLQSLETALMIPFVETLEDSLNAIMFLELVSKSSSSNIPPPPPISGTTDFEKLLLVLRLITFYLRLADGQPNKDVLAALSALAVLPSEIYDGFLPNSTLVQKTPEKGSVQPLGIGELMVLRQVPHSYSLGEIAFVENVMPGEKKIRTRKAKTLETELSEEGDQQEKLNRTRLNTGVDYDIAQEVGQVMGQQQQQFQYAPAPSSSSEVAAPATADPCSSASGLLKCFTPTSETLSGGWTLDFSPQKDLQSQAFQFVRDLTSTAVARLSQKSQQQHRRILQQERSRIDKHIFDNSQGNIPLIGIYRWINKVSLARLVSLGQRLLLQFEIPNPASGLPDAGQLQLEPGLPDLSLLEHANFEVLTPEIYFRYAAILGVSNLLPPPPQTLSVNGALASDTRQNQFVLEVPEGYAPTSLTLGYLYNGTTFSALYGDQPLSVKKATTAVKEPVLTKAKPIPLPEVPPMFPTGTSIQSGQLSTTDLQGFVNAVPISVLTDASFFTANLLMDCQVTPQHLSMWKVRAWTQLIVALKERRTADAHPPQNRSHRSLQDEQFRLVRETLRREAVQILLDSLTLNNGDPAPVNLADFLKDAILWKQMSIQYQKGEGSTGTADWRELDFDPRRPGQFDEFLEAKAARVVVGLRDRYELTGLYAIWTGGKLWDGLPGDAPILESYLFYADQLVFSDRENRNRIRKEFFISTPTDMILLQSSQELPGFEAPTLTEPKPNQY